MPALPRSRTHVTSEALKLRVRRWKVRYAFYELCFVKSARVHRHTRIFWTGGAWTDVL